MLACANEALESLCDQASDKHDACGAPGVLGSDWDLIPSFQHLTRLQIKDNLVRRCRLCAS